MAILLPVVGVWLVLLAPAVSAAAVGATLEGERTTAEATTATFTATLDPHGETTSCALQYVSQAQFEGSGYSGVAPVSCSPEQVSGASTGETVTVRVAGLTVNSTYHFRFVLSNGSETVDEPDQTFGTFGIETLGMELLDEKSEPYTQAAGHPFEQVTHLVLNTSPYLLYRSPDGNLKDVRVQLPQGFIGNPSATPTCTRYESERFECAAATQVGIITITISEVGGPNPSEQVQEVFTKPLYNVVPPEGFAAAFGARFNNFANAFIDAKVRTGEGYGVSAESVDITTLSNVTSVTVKLWGVPGSPVHNSERYCLNPVGPGSAYELPPCAEGVAPLPETPFLRTPSSCGGPLGTTVLVDSYQHPGEFQEGATQSPGMAGCEKVPFAPEIAVTPDSANSDSPTGLEVRLHVPQQEVAGVAEADLKNATVRLPAGMTVNPAAASGLAGCPLLTGKVAHPGVPGIDLESAEPAKCPDASNIGTVELETPLFPHRVFGGGIYVAQQGDAGAAIGSNPFGSLLAVYLAIDEPQTGVVVKLAGRVSVDPATGQLTTTFSENPQLPFEDLRLRLTGGSHAPLASPRACGGYQTTSLLEPWSHEAEGEPGTPDAQPLSSFQITSGPGGSACGAPGFAPSLVAGTSGNQAGGFAAFTMRLQRADGEQRFGSVSMTMPKGLAAILAGVPLCEEARASTGDCPAGSQIGHVSVQAGVGGTPVTLPQAGRREDPVYLTGPYQGAPFGLAIVVHPEAGPFNLAKHPGTPQEEPVVVRAKILVDSNTAQVSVQSGPLPSTLEGIPVDVQTIDVTVDRPRFVFNPTSCQPASVTGSIGSTEGATAAVSSRFQAAGCAGIAFHPSFRASTQGSTSKAGGASLDVRVVVPGGSANFREVHVSLPRQLPSRLDTLKLACTAAVFAADPASCPAASAVGTATAITPILSRPLSGPAYLVSHGGAAFPDLEIVLQGEGIVLLLDGKTDINEKTNVTSSTFATIPDAPVSSFELRLPEGAHSVLGAPGGNLCAQSLVMPTLMRAQNGAVLEQRTSIAVTGCKPLIRVLSHRVRGASAILVVHVPSAGKLTASGAGLSSVSKRAGRAGDVTLRLVLSRAQRTLLAKHPRRRLRTRIGLRFVPKRGRVLTTSVTVLIG